MTFHNINTQIKVHEVVYKDTKPGDILYNQLDRCWYRVVRKHQGNSNVLYVTRISRFWTWKHHFKHFILRLK